ncbi:hypothetical protein [Echinicola rosea]|nr:hypothetical protein [Echinicola rosea]
MKRQVFFFVLMACTILGCELGEDDIDPQVFIYGDWKLLNTDELARNLFYGTDGANIEETYAFYDDGSFVKSRVSNKGQAVAQGNFKVAPLSASDDGALVRLEYAAENERLRGGCATEPRVEWLVLNRNGSLSSKLEISCQAPYLLYDKILP